MDALQNKLQEGLKTAGLGEDTSKAIADAWGRAGIAGGRRRGGQRDQFGNAQARCVEHFQKTHEPRRPQPLGSC